MPSQPKEPTNRPGLFDLNAFMIVTCAVLVMVLLACLFRDAGENVEPGTEAWLSDNCMDGEVYTRVNDKRARVWVCAEFIALVPHPDDWAQE